MTDEQKAAYINAMVTCAGAEIAGMVAENFRSMMKSEQPKYGLSEFEAVTYKYRIHHNDVVELFRS